MTKLERDVWVAAFAANQPQPGGTSFWSVNGEPKAFYWAAAAVLTLRGRTESPPRSVCMAIRDEVLAFDEADRG
jgi:hypothetical protein